MSKRVTLASLKSFIRKNSENLYLKVVSSYNGMSDMVEHCVDAEYVKVDSDAIDFECKNSYGINGVWVVGGGRNILAKYEEDGFINFSVYNWCGSFVLSVPSDEYVS